MHFLIAGIAVAGAAVLVVASLSHRLPHSSAAVIWGLAAALWPAADQTARTDLFDLCVLVLTVVLCIVAVANTSKTRDVQASPVAGGRSQRRRP